MGRMWIMEYVRICGLGYSTTGMLIGFVSNEYDDGRVGVRLS